MMNHPGVSRFSPELLRAAALWRPPFQMERLASNVLDEGGIDFACDLVDSRWPHLWILVARGLLPMVTSFDRQTLLNSIGEARDRLDLPAIDPVEDTVEAGSAARRRTSSRIAGSAATSSRIAGSAATSDADPYVQIRTMAATAMIPGLPESPSQTGAMALRRRHSEWTRNTGRRLKRRRERLDT